MFWFGLVIGAFAGAGAALWYFHQRLPSAESRIDRMNADLVLLDAMLAQNHDVRHVLGPDVAYIALVEFGKDFDQAEMGERIRIAGRLCRVAQTAAHMDDERERMVADVARAGYVKLRTGGKQ